jgi:pilus assembly protein CpaB
MKSKSIVLIAISLGFGLVAAIGITQVMGRSKSSAVAEVPKKPVLIAKKDLDIDTELMADMFSVEQWPANLIAEGTVTKLEEIEGKVLLARAVKGGPVVLTNMVNKTDLKTKKIPAGFKLIGIELGSDDHIAGLLQPGDLVDLIAVVRQTRNAAPTSQTFLRKVRIYNVGTNTTKDIEARNVAKGNTVVGLLVTEKQSEQILLVKKYAELKIALRSDQDSEEDVTAANAGDDSSVNGLLSFIMNTKPQGDEAAQSAASEPKDEQKTEPKAPERFTTVVYTPEGPTQYHFEKGDASVPVRVEGFSGDSKMPNGPSSGSSNSSQPPNETGDATDGLDNADSAGSDEDIDSEPGS